MWHDDDNWDCLINLDEIKESYLVHFDKYIENAQDDILDLLKDSHVRTRKYNCDTNDNLNCDEELKILTEKNKQMLQKVDLKLEDINKQQTQYENLKQEQKLLSQGIIDRHEAYLMVKKCYKKFLKLYCSIESRNLGKQIVYVQLFTECKKESEIFSLRLALDIDSEGFQLLSVTPKIQNEKEIQYLLLKTNDLPGLICSVRHIFINIRKNNTK